MATKHHTFCRICEALCGIEVTVDDAPGPSPSNPRGLPVITAIEPDPDHVATGGFGCVKGMRQHDLYQSPDRLTAPMRRRPDGEYEAATWAEALADIGPRVRAIVADHGPDAVALYVGTAAGFSFLHPVFAGGFMEGLGSRSTYASSTQDCANKFAVNTDVYGFPFLIPYPDVDRTECLVIVGANPAVSKWSFLQVANPVERIREIQQRGGKVITVDPRRTETAQRASQHVFIRPNTDVFFYLAFLHEVVRRGAVDHALVAEHMRGYDEVVAVARHWTPERAAEVTGIEADVLRGVVDDYLAADGAALYCSTGVNMGTNGSLAYWIQEVVNAITGNLDRPGGLLVGNGIVDFPKLMHRAGKLTEDDRSRIGGLRKTNGAFAGGVLADEILTPGEGQVRALFVTGGNPLMTMANSGRLREAFEDLDLLVTLDIFLNETGSLADWVLPATAPFQRPDLPFSFPSLLGLQSRPYLQATRAVLPPVGQQLDEATIYVELARACGVDLFGSRPLQRLLERLVDRAARKDPDGIGRLPQERILSLVLRLARQGSFDDLVTHDHGKPMPTDEGADFLGQRVLTEDGRIDLAPSRLVEAVERLPELFEREVANARAGRFKLITKRQVKTHNSGWTHNAESFVGPRFNTNHLYVAPDDLARIGVAEGDLVDVSTDVATVRVPVAVEKHLMPGVAALPHGWGHQHAKGLSVSSRTTGVNVNLLAADGPDRIERESGMANLTGFVVDILPARGPLDPTNWAGIGEQEQAAIRDERAAAVPA